MFRHLFCGIIDLVREERINMASTLTFKQMQASVIIVEILEKFADYNSLVEFQEVLMSDTDDIVNFLGEVIDKKRPKKV